jgi:hypothetical protein
MKEDCFGVHPIEFINENSEVRQLTQSGEREKEDERLGLE